MGDFETIYNTYFKRVFAFLYKLCGDYTLAEDLTQDTFYQAFSSIKTFKGNSDIFTWLATIAKRCYYKYIKKTRQSLEFNGGYIYEICTDDEDIADTRDDIRRKELSCVINNILETLPEKQRDVVILRIYADLSFKEIASSLIISESSAKALFFRAKNAIADELKKEN